jgi:hypothetical protein
VVAAGKQRGHEHGRLVVQGSQHFVGSRAENIDERHPHRLVQDTGHGRCKIADHPDAVRISGSMCH